VYVVEKDNRVRNHVVTTKISNDGGGVSRSNLEVEWVRSDIIKFCLTGAEQEDSILEINVQTLAYSERKKNCS
jgi:hypothetical protein